MQCPKCDHEAAVAEFGTPARCPACGVFYEKALAHRQRLEAPLKQEPSEEVPGRLAKGLDGARHAVNEARQKRSADEAAYRAAVEAPPRPVVVVDINMSFGAMVRFMVKWVLATIPAAIILYILFWGAVSIAGLIGLR